MNNFLKTCRQVLQTKKICVVIGNESCDLDTAISSIALAFHLNSNKKAALIDSSYEVVPVLNVPRIEMPLRTEVTYLLNQNNINLEHLVCSDEIDLLKVDKFILVDHHVSKFNEKVFLVLDHRPFDSTSNLPPTATTVIEQVGSCSTLVARYIRDHADDSHPITDEIMRLLYATIVLDTVNFSQEADKARPLDREMVNMFESCLGIENPQAHRTDIFNALLTAKTDLSSLDSFQILLKDLKVIASSKQSKTVCIPGFPMLVSEYVCRDDVTDCLRKLAERYNADVILVMGVKFAANDKVLRDIGILNIRDDVLFQKIRNAIVASSEFDFQEIANCDVMDGKYFQQRNVKLSRKQLLPIIKDILNEYD